MLVLCVTYQLFGSIFRCPVPFAIAARTNRVPTRIVYRCLHQMRFFWVLPVLAVVYLQISEFSCVACLHYSCATCASIQNITIPHTHTHAVAHARSETYVRTYVFVRLSYDFTRLSCSMFVYDSRYRFRE